MPKYIPTALAIGGSDSSGGAGVQEDLKVFSALDVHGCSVITCVTAQNTRVISSIYSLPPKEVEMQLDALISDVELNAAKTGMLYSKGIVRVVAKALKKMDCAKVVDPVMVASVGRKLYTKGFFDAFSSEIVPLATVITPNMEEAEKLSGTRIKRVKDAKCSAKLIADMGAEDVIITGVPAGKEVVDVLFDGRGFKEFRGFKFDRGVHGSGCAFASAIAAFLAKGIKLEEAVKKSKDFVAKGFMFSYKIGSGLRTINSQYKVDRYAILKELEGAVEELKSLLKPPMVPEVGINFGYAIPFASSVEDVCAVRGRLTKEKGLHPGDVDFGASRHVATIILTAMRFNPETRSALNLKYDDKIVKHAKRIGLNVESFSREKEPQGRSTMEWGVETIVRKKRRMPDLIYDLGIVGKEPMIRVIGKNPKDILRKFKLLTRGMK